MNARQFLSRSKALAATALLAVVGVANAGGVSWSVGVNAPLIHAPGHVNAVVSNGPGYYYPPQPVYVQPRVIAPQRYYGMQPVVYQVPPSHYRPHAAWRHGHRHGRGEAYVHGYRRGYERGQEHAHGHEGGRPGNRGHHGDR